MSDDNELTFDSDDTSAGGEEPADRLASAQTSVPEQLTDEFALVDSDPVTSETASAGEDRTTRHLLWEITETLVLALFIFLAVRTVVLNFRVDGLSMSPTLENGEMLLVNRQIYFHFDANRVLNLIPFVDREGENIVYPLHPPERGDVIVFEPPIGSPDKPYIKRIVGLAGETVSIRDGHVFVDGVLLNEEYLGTTATTWPGRPENYELTIPENHIFVMGDNRNNSTDSRSFGPVSVDSIIGKAWIAYWPLNRFGIISNPTYEP